MSLVARLSENPALKALVRARRLLRGPKRPSWSVQMEIAAEFLRLYSPVMRRLSPTGQRKAGDLLLERPLSMDRVEESQEAVGGVSATWFRPLEAKGNATVLYLHGGGYIIGSPATHQDLIARLAHATGSNALAPDYRLAPEHPFPAGLDDALTVYRELLARGHDARSIVIAGDSAGGGLTMATLLKIRDLGLPRPAGALLISPWVDLEGTGTSLDLHDPFDYVSRPHLELCSRWYRKGISARDPLVSPIYADLRGLPPLLIQVGGAETLLDDSLRLAAKARRDGVSCQLHAHPDMVHVFHILVDFMPEAELAFAEAASFIRGLVSHGDERALRVET